MRCRRRAVTFSPVQVYATVATNSKHVHPLRFSALSLNNRSTEQWRAQNGWLAAHNASKRTSIDSSVLVRIEKIATGERRLASSRGHPLLVPFRNIIYGRRVSGLVHFLCIVTHCLDCCRWCGHWLVVLFIRSLLLLFICSCGLSVVVVDRTEVVGIFFNNTLRCTLLDEYHTP